ncbi:ATP-binding protein [Streptomyces sp. NPDC053048]|uniref:ATP-binding protein n=1 Tax=Streptomyces sp. NPDC053048 TaxID=3365694 RepID=UPI0037D0AC46
MLGKRGRRERPLDPQAGPLEEFAHGLRELRRQAGMTYAEMASRVHFSGSTLSQAAAGHRLPTLEVVLAYVRSCGGDERAWDQHWSAARRALGSTSAATLTAPSRTTTLPIAAQNEPTSFVGREREVEAGLALLARSRLVTLTGTGGVGKTRLVWWLASQTARTYRDGVYVVELADLSDPGALPDAVAAALRIAEDPARDTGTALIAELAGRNLLLVLDNCEHLHAACGSLVHTLLRAAPGLTVLATSRQALGVGGEHVLRVAPLTLPASDAPLGEDAADRYAALRLFADRAAAVQPEFRVTAANRATVAAVCRRLDGLPLAIELATRWLRVLTVGQLLERLDGTFALAAAVDPTACPRHRTMRAVLDWSHDLCTDAERAAWARISLVAGTMPLELVEDLACGPGVPEPMAAICGIVDKSLLVPTTHGDVMRYQMPETVRVHGTTRLSAEETAATRLRHLGWCRRLAEEAEADWYGPRQVAALNRIRREHHHLRMVLADDIPAGAADRLRTAASLWLYWIACGSLNEGRRWLERVLAEDHQHGPDRTRALWTCGFVALVQGDLTAAARYINTSEDQALRAGLPVIRGRAMMVRGLIHLFGNEIYAAVAESERALTACRSAADPFGTELSLAQLGLARAHRGDTDAALACYSEAVAMAEAAGEQWHLSYIHWCVGMLHLETGNPAAAVPLLRSCLRAKRGFYDRVGAAAVVEVLAWTAHALGADELAARLLGAAEAIRPAGAVGLFGVHALVADSARHSERIRAALGEPRFTAARRAGAALPPDAAMDFALTQDVGPVHGRRPPHS